MLNINADEWEPTFTCLGAAIPYMYECPGGEDDGGDRLELLSEELQIRIHWISGSGLGIPIQIKAGKNYVLMVP
jgi:hypothetical protein